MEPGGTGRAIHRGFTREELDRAYSPSSMTDGIEPYLAAYAARSAAARAAHDPSRRTTLAYGAAPSQGIDLFFPQGGSQAPAAPLLLFIHGGYWQALNKSDASFPAPAVTGAGFAYGAVDYTLAPHATLDAIVEENRAALAHLWKRRADLGLEGRGVVLSGHSAGAHLAAMLLATDWTALGVDPGFVRGGVLLGGVYDLEPIALSYVNDALGLDPAAARRNSPLHLEPPRDRPLVVAWAERDTGEFKRQSREFAARWGMGARDLLVYEQAGVNHFDCLFDWMDPGSRLFAETLRLLRGA